MSIQNNTQFSENSNSGICLLWFVIVASFLFQNTNMVSSIVVGILSGTFK